MYRLVFVYTEDTEGISNETIVNELLKPLAFIYSLPTKDKKDHDHYMPSVNVLL